MSLQKKSRNILPMLMSVLILAVFVLVSPVLVEKMDRYFLADVSTASVTVGNVAPVASSASLNGGGAITLTENTTTTIAATGTVTDNNGCLDLVSVDVAVYKDGTTCAVIGDADNDDCYFWTDSSPSTDGSCTGGTDTTYALNRNFSIYYYADPANWKVTVTPYDTGAGTPNTSSTVALNDLQALNVSATISYGSVANNATSTGDHTATVTNTGNIAIDFQLSGADLTCDGIGSIAKGNEEYALASFDHGSGTDLTASAADVNADLAAPSAGTVPVTDLTYWQIAVPYGVRGTCSGAVTFTARSAL